MPVALRVMSGALLFTVIVPVFVPGEFGSKVTVKVVLAPPTMVVVAGPLITNEASVLVTPVTFRSAAPVFVIVTVCAALGPAATPLEPKSSDPGLTVPVTGWLRQLTSDGVTVSESASVVSQCVKLSEKVTLNDVGMNCTPPVPHACVLNVNVEGMTNEKVPSCLVLSYETRVVCAVLPPTLIDPFVLIPLRFAVTTVPGGPLIGLSPWFVIELPNPGLGMA